jgi:dihydroflavonol-4-reductase
MPIAYVSEMIARITGKEPRATIDGVRMAKKNMYFSSAKAERELAYKHGAARQAICDALEWFKEKNY